MNERKILPFYMTYRGAAEEFGDYSKNEKIMEDLAYLQQLYPAGAKQILREVNLALDLLDYPGSMIYDEYPDQFLLFKLAKDILRAIQGKIWDGESRSEEEAIQLQNLSKREGIEEYITIILFQEILKRRYKNNNGYIRIF